MIFRRMSWTLLVSIVFFGCSAKDQQPERSFSYLKKPIHPSNIEKLYNSENKTLDLKTLETKSNFQEWKERPGWLIAEYDKGVESGRTSFFAYQFLANVQDRFLLLIQYSGGELDILTTFSLSKKQGLNYFY